MAQKNLYKIGNLTCQYFDKKARKFLKVLDVEDINIFKGEITVILGPSGSGKSTFMESISLMSQTIDPGSQDVFFFPHGEEEGINIAQLTLTELELQNLRFENYCFIFQDTNIMGNFNPVENVALPKMVYDPEDALKIGDKILREHLNLRIDLSKEANEYSGGQKQRFAFARAFMAKGDLLFGDEPTGNLDKYNSEKLFGVIRQHIMHEFSPTGSDEVSAGPVPDELLQKPGTGESKEVSTTNESPKRDSSVNKIGAIIVTHSIDLALQFADRIIVIVKPERIDDEKVLEESKKKDIRGYTNPFLVYRNNRNNAWRSDAPLKGNLEDGGILPPIDDDGSTRFEYLTEKIPVKAEEGAPPDAPIQYKETFIKDRLKKEIIFFLNNSYAAPQEVLIHAAKKLNEKLRPLRDLYDAESMAAKAKLFRQFDELKTQIIDIVDKKAAKKMELSCFERNDYLYRVVRGRFSGNDEILSLLPELPVKKSESNPNQTNLNGDDKQ